MRPSASTIERPSFFAGAGRSPRFDPLVPIGVHGFLSNARLPVLVVLGSGGAVFPCSYPPAPSQPLWPKPHRPRPGSGRNSHGPPPRERTARPRCGGVPAATTLRTCTWPPTLSTPAGAPAPPRGPCGWPPRRSRGARRRTLRSRRRKKVAMGGLSAFSAREAVEASGGSGGR